jgi:hypothetical protein
LLLQCSLSISLFFPLIITLLLRRTTLLGRTLLRSLPLGCALSLGSLSAFIRALLLFRSATVLLLERALTRGSPLLRGTLSFCHPARSGLISARRSGWGRLWRASGRALRYGCLRRPRLPGWRTRALRRRSRPSRCPGGATALFSVLWTLSRELCRSCH